MSNLPTTAKEVMDSGVKSKSEARKIAAKNRSSLPKASPEERLAELDKQFGKGKGASKERARLEFQRGSK
jgi:hypothetical protein